MKMSIKKISELSGFSPATVSNALNNKRGVSSETCEKILRIAREYGYITDDKVRRIRVVTYRDSGEVFSDSPFFSDLLEGIENESRKRGYETTIINLYRQRAEYGKQLQELLNDASSGILLIGTELTEENAKEFQQAVAPIILVDCWFPHLPFDAVLMDNEDSAMQAVEYLIDQGHRHIGYIKGSVRIQNFECRARGFYRAMEGHGMPIEEKFILPVQPSIHGAHAALIKLLAEGSAMPTAFFADNDMIALGAMQAFQAQGWKIPDDISIIGFDDITFSSVFSPGLTTVNVYKKELGQVAVRRMIELLREHPATKIRTQLVNELVIRGSVSLPRKIEETER